MTALAYLGRLAPSLGLLANTIRYRNLRCGLHVEILGPGRLVYGKDVKLGQGTRIELPPQSRLDLGDDVSVSRGAHIVPETGRAIFVGAGSTIQDGCRIYGDVAIGLRCILAPNTFVSSGTHAFAPRPCRPIQEQDQLTPISTKPIRIYGDCWFGINSVLLPGVSIGRGCVIGANSVVNEDLPPFTVAAGNPARIVKQRLAFAPKSRIVATDENDWPYFYDGFALSLRANEQAFVASSDFTLALEHPGARVIRLLLGESEGEIGFAGHRRSLPRRSDMLEFELAPQLGQMPFLRFEVDGCCRIHSAELV
jgi:acetyltransferase-like isoleucine patch superfamily enzyme